VVARPGDSTVAEGFALAWTEYQPASGQIHDGIGEIAFTLIE
jgi:hypothetical protein